MQASCWGERRSRREELGTVRRTVLGPGVRFSLTTSIVECSFVATGVRTVYGACFDLGTSTGETQICHCKFSDGIGCDSPACSLSTFTSCVITFSSFESFDDSSLNLLYVTSSIDILNCRFVQSTGSFGGAISLVTCSALLTVKDSLFDQCTATRGGGISASETPSFNLNNLKFRDCTAGMGNAVSLDITREEIDEDMIKNCVSSANEKNVFLMKGSLKYPDDLILYDSSIEIPSITLSASLDRDDVKGSLRVTVNASVEGRILILLENKENGYQRPNADSPPPITRLFMFDFSTTSTTSSKPVLFGEWNLLQYEANYSVTISSLAGTDIALSPSLLETPNPARIVEVITDWSSSRPEQLSFQLKGRTLLSGNYIVKVKEVPDLSLVVSFTGNPTSPESRNMHSSNLTLFLFGEGAKLTFDTTYEIESVEKGDGTFIILDPPRLFFTTPNPPRLMSVNDAVFPDPLDKSTVTIALFGINLPTGLNSLNVSLIGDHPSTEITLTASFSSEESGTARAVVFDAEDGDVDILFDSEYSIESLWNENGSIWIPSYLTIVVPSSPGIVESVESVSLNDAKTIVTLTLCGTDFVPGPTHVVLSDGSEDVTSKGGISVVNKTHCTVSFAAGWTQSSSTVAYGQSYSVKSVSSSSTSFLVRSSVLVNIPEAPCVTSISCTLTTNFTHFEVTVSGSALPTSGTYTARLESSSFSFDVSLSEGVWKSEPIEGNATNGLFFGTTYTISSISRGNDKVLLNTTSFSTPAGPTLSNVSCALDSSDLSFAVLTLSGLRMPSSSDYKFIVVETGGSTQVTLDVSFTSSTEGNGIVEVYSKPNTLQYGHSYSVISLSLGSLSISLPSPSITFSLPDPPRLTGVNTPIFLNPIDKSTVSMSLSGCQIPPEQYSMNVSLVGGGSSDKITLNASFSSEESGTARAVVFDAEDGDVDILFDSEYSIESLWNENGSIWIPSYLTIVVPSSPGIVESVESVSLNDAKTIVTLTLCGTDFVPGPTHVVLSDGSEDVTSNNDLTVKNDTHLVVTVPTGWTQSSSSVAYGQSYSVKLVGSSSSSLLVRSSVFVNIPNAPCVTSISSTLAPSFTHFVITLSGSALPTSGPSTARLTEPLFDFSVTFMNGVGTSEPIEGNATNGLLFNSTYTPSSLTLDGDLILLNATSFSTPAGPTLSNVSCALDSSDLSFAVLTLSGLRMPSSSDYKLTVVEVGRSTQVTLDVSFTSSTEGNGSVEVYSKENTLQYGHSYSVSSLFLGSLSISLPSPSITFDTPPAPIRVEDANAALNDIRTEVIVELSGMSFVAGDWQITLPTTPPRVVRGELGKNGKIVCSVEADETDHKKLLFGSTYIVSAVKLNGNEVIVNDDVFFTVPHAPFVTAASFSFVNRQHTSCKLSFEGTFLVLGEYNVTLDPPFWVVVSFSSASLGTTGEMKIGWADSIRYSQTFKIQSIVRTDNVNDVIQFDSDIEIATEPKPDSIVLFVNSSGSSSPFCGDSSLPCSSMDVGFSIVSGIGFTRSEMKIVESANQSSRHSMSSGSVLSISTSSTISATLEIGSSTTVGSQTGLFVVSSARLEFHEISVSVLQTDPSFVLVSADNSTLVLKNTSFSGNPLLLSSLNFELSEHSQFVCDWSTGLFRLSNSITNITSSQLHDLPQGALNMKNGTLTLRESSFDGNTPHLDSFPSARRNILCTDEGKVNIGSLSSGDGSKDHPSAWISSSDCVLSGDDAQRNSPLFVPTLSSESTSSWHKKEKQFDVTILGTTLVPCGLFLEVYDVQKNKPGVSRNIELTQQSATSFTESNITFTLPASSLSDLDSSLEWRGRLVFGHEQRTTDFFVIQNDASSRMAQTVKDNMKWWIPLVVVLSCILLALTLIIVLCRQRHLKKEEAKAQSAAEIDQQEMEVAKLEEDPPTRSDNLILSSDQFTQPTSQQVSLSKEQAVQPTIVPRGVIPVQNRVEAISCDGEMKTVVVNKMDTLFERLHTKKMVFDRRQIEQMIVRGLTQLMERRHEETGLRLSSHWVLFDSEDKVCLKLGFDKVDRNEKNDPSSPQLKVNEDIRWQAPEQKRRKDGEEEKEVNANLVSVFRLGLVLYEIETGLVPVSLSQ
ncbi:hypothetical protein BLNAU_23238 [Blattamonas nauphoetae]|uniref:Uncharacterized protein n=1 Tax=Blattamonas nauphoetae TaxID=2049346 RepID=A0ABQ9WSZ0_9EUKA|nr:hypothetical protein BLNAU_23238 [Blattamonas nauphoetae]